MTRILSLGICALGLLAVAACGGGPLSPIPIIRNPVYVDHARIDRLEIWPEQPVAGQTVEVLLDVHRPGGIRAQNLTPWDGNPPNAEYRVSGGQLRYDSHYYDRATRQWRDVEINGNSCLGPVEGFRWTLPSQPGTYTLRVTYWDISRSLRVCIE